jgi:hypothetical protein
MKTSPIRRPGLFAESVASRQLYRFAGEGLGYESGVVMPSTLDRAVSCC